jgi:thioredoxin-like negative regulator of GroEL
MRPVVNGLEDEYPGKIRVVTLDYGNQADLRIARRLNADFHPAMVFLRADGTVLRVVIGLQSPEQIRRNVELLLSQASLQGSRPKL